MSRRPCQGTGGGVDVILRALSLLGAPYRSVSRRGCLESGVFNSPPVLRVPPNRVSHLAYARGLLGSRLTPFSRLPGEQNDTPNEALGLLRRWPEKEQKQIKWTIFNYILI